MLDILNVLFINTIYREHKHKTCTYVVHIHTRKYTTHPSTYNTICIPYTTICIYDCKSLIPFYRALELIIRT